MADTMDANGGSNGFAPKSEVNPDSGSSVTDGPVAQTAQNEFNKTANEFAELSASRRTPTQTTATNQSLTHYHSYFFSLLSWKNPRASGIAYTTIVSLILAARYLDVVRWGFRFAYMALGATVAAEVAGQALLGSGLTSQLRPRKYYKVSRETLDVMIGDVHELINFFIIEFQRILFVENIPASAAAFVAAFVSYYLVNVVPYWGLAIIGTTVAFIVPLVYTSNQELIDAQIKNASDIVNAQTAQLRSAAGKHTSHVTDLTKQYMGDYSAKAQNMIRGRSASPEAATFPAAPTHQPVSALDESDFPRAPADTLEKDAAEAADVPIKTTEEEPLL